MIEGKVIEILDTHNEGTLVSTLHLLIWILTPLCLLSWLLLRQDAYWYY
jgi:hypothetical protein